MSDRIACVDIGSTWTEAALVELPGGRLLETRQAPTTSDDVVAGVLAVVGYEELISAEAGVLRHNAAALAGEDRSVPGVVAGNTAVRDEVCAVLTDGGVPVIPAANVLPDIGQLAPGWPRRRSATSS